MPSSISSSKSPALVYLRVLLGICAILVLLLEICANYLLKQDSETYARVSQQYAEAVKVRSSRSGEPASVLMVGNSLLMEGIDVDRLQELTSSKMRIYPIFLEATGYYDWLYGLQRLFRQGARPQVVVLGVGVNSFLQNSVRQDYAPMLFFDVRDVLGAAADLNLDRTATSNLLLAHLSVFWDTRSVIRTQVLRRMVPHCKELFSLVKPKPALPPAPELAAITTARIRSLRQLCEAHGAKLILLVPPTPSSEQSVRQMAIASEKAGVDSLVPIDPATLSERFYQPDELHLNSEGAALFTSALATYLPVEIGGPKSASSPD
ncbi:MAG: hypothetical protein DMG50_13215 [Acidobacteria bacterium]|nr:MAG: hypothetical protein DMG50_13215 [Acidobacteriota bacterium]